MSSRQPDDLRAAIAAADKAQFDAPLLEKARDALAEVDGGGTA